MARRKRINLKQRYRYEIAVTEWYVEVSFNDYAYFSMFDRQEFEESFYMILEGRISSTMSKKCKKNMAAKVILHPGDFWYDRQRIREDVHTIGDMSIEKANDIDDK